MSVGSAPARELGVRERKKLDTWLAIRKSAVSLFMEHGMDAVSVDEIAAAAGVARTTFFNYFASKDAVMLDCAPGEREAWQHLLERPVDEPLWDSLVALLLGMAQIRADRLTEVRWVMLQTPRLQVPSFEHIDATYVDIEAFVAQRTRPGRELEAELCLRVALVAGETAFRRWDPTVPFSEYLVDTLDCLDRVGVGFAGNQWRATRGQFS